MKKQFIIASVILLTFALIGLGLHFRSNSDSEELVTVANTEPVVELDQSMIKLEDRVINEFVYGMGPRFSPIKRTELLEKLSVDDFIDMEAFEEIKNLKSTSVILIVNDERTKDVYEGQSMALTSEQLYRLESSPISTNFVFQVAYESINAETGLVENHSRSPHHTIVPEFQAEYEGGEKAILNFLKEQIRPFIQNINSKKLSPAKLYFTVDSKGNIKMPKMNRTSGYPEIDQKMMQYIKQLPGQWKPARDVNNTPVDQELVISFGAMGC